jgi:histidinol-phosphate aminotransferase
MPRPRTLIRPLVRRMKAYVPGEQPQIRGLVKLNTNENPYPPSPLVLATVRAAADERLRRYPNPTSSRLRARLAALHGCAPEQVLVGNGSDEILALAVRAFVEPASTPRARPHARTTVQYFTPSYTLYPVLAAAHGAAVREVRLDADFGLPPVRALRARGWRADAAVTFVTTPNAPSGRGYTTRDLEALCRRTRGVIVLDEAYADFADEDAMALALRYPHVLVARTFSKGFSLCFQRVGYVVGHPELIAALDTIRDSYNVNGLGQLAAEATLASLPYYRDRIRTLQRTRDALTIRLRSIGFTVLPSQTNFLFAKPPRLAARVWLQRLREQKVLVRWFDTPATREYLRITIGTEQETAALLRAVRRILS